MKLLLKSSLMTVGLWSGLCASINAYADYSEHPLAEGFVQDMVSKYDFAAEDVRSLLKKAEKRQSILDAISRPAEKTKTWKEYRPIFMQQLRIINGVAFWSEHQKALNEAEKEFGVPAEIIVAIIGVETNYGKNTGSYLVLDALSTLAFDYPPRAPFFRSELENYLVLTREHKQDATQFKGSYAGAMGYGQFMPSSYRKFAVDFTGDDFADIWKNPRDAIGSVANYFVQHGWQPGKPVIVPAYLKVAREEVTLNNIVPPVTSVQEWQKKGVIPTVILPDQTPAIAIEFDGAEGLEYWLGLQNFYTITRYNRSPMYAMAVYQLSKEIKLAKNKKVSAAN